MREVKYLSPTSLALFESNPTEFYLKYLAEHRPPRLPQTEAMSVGAAFDAFVKNYLVYALHGKVEARFEIEAIFEEQVEPHNRDFAFDAGEYCFDCYRQSGALANLMLELQQAEGEPQFEFKIEQRVGLGNVVDGIPLLGKPDIYFRKPEGARVIYDWKVNGYCSKSPVSPAAGYVMCRDSWNPETLAHSRSHGQQHKRASLMNVGGIMINIADGLETVKKDWATQLAIYMWILGEEVGTRAIVGIDQLCCAPTSGSYPLIRVATHRCRVGEEFQRELEARIVECWNAVCTGWVFRNMTREENDDRCRILDSQYKAYQNPVDYHSNEEWEAWFQSETRRW